jgi:hypothetical protein
MPPRHGTCFHSLVMDTLPNPGTLTVVIAGHPVGTLQVRECSPKKVFGHFAPNANFAPYRCVFEPAMELARQFDATRPTQSIDYPLWDRLMEACEEINRLKPTLAEMPSSIEEFAIDADWSVEITFDDNRA